MDRFKATGRVCVILASQVAPSRLSELALPDHINRKKEGWWDSVADMWLFWCYDLISHVSYHPVDLLSRPDDRGQRSIKCMRWRQRWPLPPSMLYLQHLLDGQTPQAAAVPASRLLQKHLVGGIGFFRCGVEDVRAAHVHCCSEQTFGQRWNHQGPHWRSTFQENTTWGGGDLSFFLWKCIILMWIFFWLSPVLFFHTGTLSNNGDLLGISSKNMDVLLNPFQSCNLVHEAIIA